MQITNPRAGQVQKGKMQNALRVFAFSLYVRKTLVLVIFIVVVVFALLMAIFLPPVYRATAKFTISIPKKIDPLAPETAYDFKNQFRRQLNQQKELLTSNRVLIKVMEQLSYGNTNKPSKWLGQLRSKLEVTPPKGETFEGTSSFHVNFDDSNPHRAARFADAIARAFMDTFNQLAQEKADYSYTFFKEQTKELFQKLKAKEKKLRDYEREQAVLLIEILNLDASKGAGVETSPNSLLTRALGKYHQLQEDLAGIQISINTMALQLDNKNIPVVLPDMEVSGRALTVFKRKVAQLQIQLNEMKPRFRERFELMRQVEKELSLNIDSLKNELERTVQAKRIQAQSIEARLGELDNVISGLKDQIRITAKERATYEQLKSDYDLARQAYLAATSQLEQARLGQAVDSEKHNLTLIDPAIVPEKPYKPNRMLIVLLGIIAGAMLGVSTVLMLDFSDHSLRSNEEIEYHLDIAVLGSIPKMS